MSLGKIDLEHPNRDAVPIPDGEYLARILNAGQWDACRAVGLNSMIHSRGRPIRRRADLVFLDART
jgi:hypothetical protein